VQDDIFGVCRPLERVALDGTQGLPPANPMRWNRIQEYLPQLKTVDLRRIAYFAEFHKVFTLVALDHHTRGIPSCKLFEFAV
jgi:hypothetical protein